MNEQDIKDLIAGCQRLPLDMIDRRNDLDASEFVDHSEDFISAMEQIKKVLERTNNASTR